ncbi:MAG: SH3 domain-containing protein [Lachnospiraceae bacterium]|nr:SH3 domain-containing protein [Lachnospiraceae bacterium]
MKKLMTKLAVIMLAITLTVGFAGGENDFNWAQWYDWNGVYSVIDMVAYGSMTSIEACDTVIIPAHQAGFVTENHMEIFTEYYPETKSYLITNGVISGETSDNPPTPTAEPTPAVPAYTIEECDMYKYATTDVNIRTEPSTNAGKVGNVPQNEQVHVTGKTSNGWYRLEYNGVTGFSVAKYFADKPIEEVVGVTDATPAPTEAPTPEPTEVPVATEAPVEPTAEPTTTPESDTRTEIIEPIVEPTPAPTAVPTTAPVAEATAEPTGNEGTTEVVEPTEAPVAEPTTVPVVDPAPAEEDNSVVPIVAGGVIGLALVIGFGVWLIKKRR